MINKAIDLISARITNNALDVGSGFGFYSAYSLDKGFKITAINPSKWENDVFEKMNGFRPMDKFIEDISFYQEKFDLIIMSQVLEHIDSVDDVLNKIKSWMIEKGILVIAVPNIDSFLVKLLGTRDNGCLLVPEHLNYFSKEGLMNLLSRNGFRVMHYQQISRIPYNFLSNRLKLTGKYRKICNKMVKISQKPLISMMNILGLGLYHNVCVAKDVDK